MALSKLKGGLVGVTMLWHLARISLDLRSREPEVVGQHQKAEKRVSRMTA